MANASDAVFRIDPLIVRSFFHVQLSSIGVFGTEANTGFMLMCRSGSRRVPHL